MKEDAINSILNSLKEHGIDSAIVSKDGEFISSNIKLEDYEMFATTTSLIYGSAEKASLEFKKGIPDNITIETEKGSVVLKGAGKGLLIALFQKNLQLENTMQEINNASKKIENHLYIKDIYLTFS